jgi:acetyltransferase EpsM
MTAAPPRAVVVIGGRSDGHGKVVLETARTVAGLHVLGFLDDNAGVEGVAGFRKLGRSAEWRGLTVGGDVAFHVAIGDNAIRRRVATDILAAGGTLASIVHSRALIFPSASIGDGTFVGAGAMLCPGARTGIACIVNHGVIVEHDSVLADHVNLSTGCVTGGRVHFGEGAFAGVGCRFIPDVKVAPWTYVGAGAAVIADTEPSSLYVGVPARRVRALDS